MKKYLLCLAGLVWAGVSAHAATVLTPEDLVNQANFGPTNPYGWDWSQGAPEGSTAVGGAPGYGTSSWYSNVQGSAVNVPGDRDYTALRINVAGMFGAPVTMADLEEVSYWTFLESGTLDWQLKIYTVENSPGVGSTWYGHRFNFDTPTFPAQSGWNYSSTATNLDVNWITNGGGGVANNDYTSQSLTTAAATYANEVILFIDIIAGYATSSPPVYSYLDGVSITVDGVTKSLDLAVVPVPAAAPLGLVGMGLIAFLRRRKKATAA